MAGVPASEKSTVASKGLKVGALGLLSTIVIGVASTAPAYSLAATLGSISGAVSFRSPIIMILAFVPMLFIAFAYRALNEAEPDCGTSFTWVMRAFGRHTGWITGWVIVAADVIVMANLAQIAGQYGFLLFNLDGLASSIGWSTLAGCIWILLMTWISWRGIELSARTQVILLACELGVLFIFSVAALVKVYAGNAGALAIHPSWSWFSPSGLTSAAFAAGFLGGLFIYWGWDTAAAVNEETKDSARTPGLAAVLSTLLLLLTYVVVTVAAQAFAGTGTKGIGLANPEHTDDVLSSIGNAVLGGGWGKLLIIAVLSSAAASTQTTILPTARTTLSMAAGRALPRVFGKMSKHKTPSVSTWAMGIVSILFFAGLAFYNEGNLLFDLILSIGLLIAFYYGLTGFASAWYFRKELRHSQKALWLKGILPLLGGIILLVAFVKSAIDMYDPDSSYTHPFGIGGQFVVGIGSIVLGLILMIIYNIVRPAYFRGRTMERGTVVTETGEVIRDDAPPELPRNRAEEDKQRKGKTRGRHHE
ncbi:MAG: APC family permease [Actinocatenispora sp.]